MQVPRSSYYYWVKRLKKPAKRSVQLAKNISLFVEYHNKYPSHGYRWLKAKIELDLGVKMSAPYAHKCCKIAGIKSKAKHCKYKKPGALRNVYANLLLEGLDITGPMQCIASDMTMFYKNSIGYELTLYMDLWNNEIISHSLSSKRGDRMTYISGLKDVMKIKKQYPEFTTVLHSDQGSVYASRDYNELLESVGFLHSMSRVGTPTDNAAIESINGWMKTEIFTDFHLKGDNIKKEIEQYIKFFNEERPAYSLNYLTPKQYKELYAGV